MAPAVERGPRETGQPREPDARCYAVAATLILASSLLLLLLGSLAAHQGGASRWRGALRVGFWGAVAMGATALVGRLFGAAV